MKYDIDQEFKEILNRGRRIRKKQEENRLKVLSGSITVMMVMLVVMISRFSNGEHMEEASQYGAYMLSSETGGYVLIAVIAFILGITVAFLCLRYRNRRKK